MRVELFLAKEDFTWATEVIEVPDAVGKGHEKGDPYWEQKIVGWAHKELEARGIVLPLIAVWDAFPDDVEPDEEEIASIPQDVE